MKDRTTPFSVSHLEEPLSPIDGIGRHDQAVPLGKPRCEELLQDFRPAGTVPSGHHPLPCTVLQNPGEPLLPLLAPLAPCGGLPLLVGDPSPPVVAELLEGPARQIQKDHEGTGCRREVRLGAVGDFSDQLGQGGLRIEKAGLGQEHNFGARDQRRRQKGLADGIDSSRLVVHDKEVQIPVLCGDQGVDNLPQGLFHKEILIPVQEVTGCASSLRDVLQDTLETLFCALLFLAHSSVSVDEINPPPATNQPADRD